MWSGDRWLSKDLYDSYHLGIRSHLSALSERNDLVQQEFTKMYAMSAMLLHLTNVVSNSNRNMFVGIGRCHPNILLTTNEGFQESRRSGLLGPIQMCMSPCVH